MYYRDVWPGYRGVRMREMLDVGEKRVGQRKLGVENQRGRRRLGGSLLGLGARVRRE